MHLPRLISFLLACVLSPVCLARTVEIDPRGERLYQQALPHLQDAEKNLQMVDFKSPASDIQATNRELGARANAQLQIAVPLLEQAAALEHPVAQYRLALIYLTYSPRGSEEEACTLLEKSLGHGFAPPAVTIASACFAYTDAPEYRSALESVLVPAPTYESYFPQPAMNLACRREEALGAGFQWATSRDYQAEIYWLLGVKNRAQRSEFAQKAFDINGCSKAQQWVGKLKPSEG
jgi:TPR repeat protein